MCGIIYFIVAAFIGQGTVARRVREFDYVVVGGGTAGCVLANRLSKDPNTRVLVLEAGKDPIDDPFVPVPLAFYTVHTDPDRDWGIYTEPQRKSGKKEKLWLGQAKMLGGCGSHNALEYIRGSRHDFDRWAELGNVGWDYESVLPYFKRVEDMTIPELANSSFHGTGGPLTLRKSDSNPIMKEIKKAAIEIGLGFTEDMNGKKQEGFGYLQMNVDNRGHRLSTLDAFLRPVRMRKNLEVITEALVTKILFKKKGKRVKAIGVQYVKNGKRRIAKAKLEVIVSGGSLNSPKLLMLSGVGPRKHLKEKGIKVIANLPVGRLLQDHIGVPLEVTVQRTSPIEIKKVHTFESLFEYIFTGKGPYSTNGAPANAFYKVNSQPKEDKFPYIEHLIGSPGLLLTGKYQPLQDSIRNGSGIIPALVKQIEEEDEGFHKLDMSTTHLHKRSNGRLTLRSTDPNDPPVIQHEYLDNQIDVDEMIKGIRTVQKMINSKVLQKAKVNKLTEVHPNCVSQKFDSAEYWDCYIRYMFKSALHYTSTCRMAPDSTGVVDNKLRVKGISGLRVVDASIMPLVPSGHTHAPTVMIAEKAAEMILQAHT